MNSYIYAMSYDDTAVKIGFTKHLRNRLSQFKVHVAGTLDVLYREGTKQQEKEIHLQLRQWRIRGEWFQKDALAVQEVLASMTIFILPPKKVKLPEQKSEQFAYSIRDEILKIEGRVVRLGLAREALHHESGIAGSTWQRWKRGTHGPNIRTWDRCVAAADRLCGPAERA